MSLSVSSLATPSKNRGDYLQATIGLVPKQEFPKIEYLLVDGGSMDDSVDMNQGYPD